MVSEEENSVASEHTQISPLLRGAIVGFGSVAAKAHLYLTRQSDLRCNDGVIIGDRGVIHINDDHLLLETTAGSPPIRYDFSEPLSAGSHHPSWMKSVLKDFYNEIIESRTYNPLQNSPYARACSI